MEGTNGARVAEWQRDHSRRKKEKKKGAPSCRMVRGIANETSLPRNISCQQSKTINRANRKLDARYVCTGINSLSGS
jgi:hypothetical protein